MAASRDPKGITDFGGFRDVGQDAVLAIDSALANLGGSWAVYCDVAGAFLEQMNLLLPQLAEHGAPGSLLGLIHEAGSSLGAVGALHAHDLARALERRLRTGEPLDPESLVALRGTIAAAVEAVRRLLTRRP